jgi:hypothetical protein
MARSIDEIDALLTEISATPVFGIRLSSPLDGLLARHIGREQSITIVFKAGNEQNALYFAPIAFVGQNWFAERQTRKGRGSERRR